MRLMPAATATSKTLGRNVRAHRLRMGWTQEGLGEEAGMHRTQIGVIERGESNATLETLDKLAAALSIELWLLLKPEVRAK